jgi:hypothetical protein
VLGSSRRKCGRRLASCPPRAFQRDTAVEELTAGRRLIRQSPSHTLHVNLVSVERRQSPSSSAVSKDALAGGKRAFRTPRPRTWTPDAAPRKAKARCQRVDVRDKAAGAAFSSSSSSSISSIPLPPPPSSSSWRGRRVAPRRHELVVGPTPRRAGLKSRVVDVSGLLLLLLLMMCGC